MTANRGYSIEQLRTITKAASLYHQHGLKQPEIAERMDFSQAGVSRALRDAERLGIVRTTVHMPSDIYSDLEIALEKRFGLKDAVVLEVTGQNEEERTASLGEGAAAYLENILPKADVIGIGSWSSVLAATVAALRLTQKPRAKAVVAIGSDKDPLQNADPAEVLAKVCGLAAATRIADGKAPDSTGILSGISLLLFEFAGAGAPLSLPAIPKRIGIAGDQKTCAVIRAALAENLLTTLITDFKTATRLMGG